MGLDMYLSAKRYVGGWDFSKEDEKTAYNAVMKAINKPGWRCEGSPHLEVEASVAYWRKANQVHAWFVENVQGGNDDCNSYEVSAEQLQELVNLCKGVIKGSPLVEGQVVVSQTLGKGGKWIPNHRAGKVIKDPAVAKSLLPTQSGCFFGGTEYDEFYVADLEDTIKQLEKALEEFPEREGWSFHYQSSW